MIEHIEISASAYTPDDTTKKYVKKKLGRLDRYIPRRLRGDSVSLQVVLKQVDNKNGNKYEVDAKLTFPGKVMEARDSTLNMLAAVDIVEEKLESQLRRAKDAEDPRGGRRRLFARRKKEVLAPAEEY